MTSSYAVGWKRAYECVRVDADSIRSSSLGQGSDHLLVGQPD